jgi:tRNA(Ile)-lysidine synthase
MQQQVLATIRRYGMFASGDRVVVAVSAGPDSVCLLHLLRELAPALDVAVAGIAHVNHKLRGKESDLDECFVADTARALGLPFHRTEAPVGEASGNLEQAARRARAEFFRELIARDAATRIAQGHTRDDQAETVLFRLLRGSGLAGLAGVLPVTTSGFVRPLLQVTRAEVTAFLKERGIPWRQDSSNTDPRFARNRIRLRLLPDLTREWNPRLSEALAHLADLAYEEECWWASECARLAPGIMVAGEGFVEIDTRPLAHHPRAIVRRLLRYAIRRAKGDLRKVGFEHIEQLADVAAASAGRGTVILPGIQAVRSFDWVRITRLNQAGGRAEAHAVSAPGRYPSPDGKSLIELEIIDGAEEDKGCATLKTEVCCEGLVLRGWRPGDHYRPVGRSHDHKLKEMFQEARIPSWRRAAWPILSSGDKILWAREFGPAAEYVPKAASGARLRVREVFVSEG